MYYPSSENKGTDQLCGYSEADLRLCFRICSLLVFSRGGSFYVFFYDQDTVACERVCQFVKYLKSCNFYSRIVTTIFPGKLLTFNFVLQNIIRDTCYISGKEVKKEGEKDEKDKDEKEKETEKKKEPEPNFLMLANPARTMMAQVGVFVAFNMTKFMG